MWQSSCADSVRLPPKLPNTTSFHTIPIIWTKKVSSLGYFRTKRVFIQAYFESGKLLGAGQDGNREWITILATVSMDGSYLPPSTPSTIYLAISSNLQGVLNPGFTETMTRHVDIRKVTRSNVDVARDGTPSWSGTRSHPPRRPAEILLWNSEYLRTAIAALCAVDPHF